MDLEPNSYPAGATPDTGKMIALQNEKALPERQSRTFARGLFSCDRVIAGNGLLRDGIVCTDQRLTPTAEATSDRVIRHRKAISPEVFLLWLAPLLLKDALPEADDNGHQFVISGPVIRRRRVTPR